MQCECPYGDVRPSSAQGGEGRLENCFVAEVSPARWVDDPYSRRARRCRRNLIRHCIEYARLCDSRHGRTPFNSTLNFRETNASAYPDGARHSTPRSRMSPRNVASSNQSLLRWEPNNCIRALILRRAMVSVSGM